MPKVRTIGFSRPEEAPVSGKSDFLTDGGEEWVCVLQSGNAGWDG